MIKHLSVFLLLALFIPTMIIAQNRVVHKAPLKIDAQNEYSNSTRTSPPFIRGLQAADWMEIDTMSNTFGPASPTLNPVAFDPVSGVAAVVHRGDANTYAQGSGELWWNYSTDMGMTWPRSTTSVQDQFTSQILARYPSMTIVNPTGSTNLADLWGAFGWPELNPSSFGWLGYGVTIGMEVSAFADINQGPPTYSSNVPTFTDNQYVYWVSDNQDDASLRLFRTADYGTIDITDPPQWASAVFQDNGNIAMGGVCYNGKVYYAVMGSFITPSDTNNGWFPGYSVSEDNGSTWSSFNIADWRNIPAFSMYDELWDWKKGDAFISYAGDINVDMNGMVHMVVGLTDYTDPLSEYGVNAIVELYETAQNPSVWDAKVIVDNLNDSSLYVGPALSGYNYDPAVAQSGESPFIATNADRDFFAAQWVYKAPDDSTCEVWMSYRFLDSTAWSTAVNLTETPDMNEDAAHLAPMLAETVDGNTTTYTAFSMYVYESGYFGRWPNPVNETSVYMAAVPVTSVTTVGIDDNTNTTFSYQLNQNYPNPFNPTTQIKYTLAENSNVTLKVYDMLGKEVATLVNESQNAGAHSINFNASDLASGLYIYKIQAGNFTQAKKMMLLK